ncbi:MAG: carbonic anhydrase [Actinomycetota bacterium]
MSHDGPIEDAEFSPNADDLVARNDRFAESFPDAGMAVRPQRALAVVACMDARMDVNALLGLQNGEAHIVRNAGGVITDDVIRSLCLSQRMLGTREIVLVHHTDCGLQAVDEPAFRKQLESDTGVRPNWAIESFDDPFEDVRQSIRRLRLTPFLTHKEHIEGFVYDVETGKILPVDP